MLITPLLERPNKRPTKKNLMVEASGLNSPVKLLEVTKLVPQEVVKPLLFSLETLVSEPSNGPSRSSSRAAVKFKA